MKIDLKIFLPNFLKPFHQRSNIKCNVCGRIQKQPIKWVTNWAACQYGCDNIIFIDGSGQCSSSLAFVAQLVE